MDTYSKIHSCFEQPSKDFSKPYCVYITFYRGNKLPPFYLGSGKTMKVISKKYFGSPKSKRYSSIFKQELNDTPHLFECKVLYTFSNRKQATLKEYKLLKLVNAPKNNLYINQALPAPNGFFGMENGGDLHPMYGTNRSGNLNPNFGKKWNENQRKKLSNFRKEYTGWRHKSSTRKKMADTQLGVRWCNNGIFSYRLRNDEDISMMPPGFIYGKRNLKSVSREHIQALIEDQKKYSRQQAVESFRQEIRFER